MVTFSDPSVLEQRYGVADNSTGRLVLKKLSFCVGEQAEYGFDQKRLVSYVFHLWGLTCS